MWEASWFIVKGQIPLLSQSACTESKSVFCHWCQELVPPGRSWVGQHWPGNNPQVSHCLPAGTRVSDCACVLSFAGWDNCISPQPRNAEGLSIKVSIRVAGTEIRVLWHKELLASRRLFSWPYLSEPYCFTNVNFPQSILTKSSLYSDVLSSTWRAHTPAPDCSLYFSLPLPDFFCH